MLIAPLFGTALVYAVATEPLNSAGQATQVSPQQKMAATDPLVRSATDCIVRAVTADSMPACRQPVRAMIDAYDRYYGDGSGEAFFMGPYLDVLPRAVVERAKKAQQ